jgi:hypothetical protein
MSPLRHDCFLALPVAIIATGFLAEIRWRDFIVNYGMMAHVLAFAGLDAAALAELVGLLRARRFLVSSLPAALKRTLGLSWAGHFALRMSPLD